MKTFSIDRIFLKLALTGLCGILSFSAHAAMAQHHPHHEPLSTHGMLIFGTGKIFANHLPMFHIPHAQQAVWGITMNAAATAQYLDAKKKNPNEIFTILPEPFVLSDMIANPHPFKAALYLGHFERGGKELVPEVTITPEDLLIHKKLSGDEKIISSRWTLIGDLSESFLIHEIQGAPGFDQIAQLDVSQMSGDDLATLKKSLLVAKLNPSTALQALQSVEIASGLTVLKLDVLKSIYLETGDLAQ